MCGPVCGNSEVAEYGDVHSVKALRRDAGVICRAAARSAQKPAIRFDFDVIGSQHNLIEKLHVCALFGFRSAQSDQSRTLDQVPDLALRHGVPWEGAIRVRYDF